MGVKGLKHLFLKKRGRNNGGWERKLISGALVVDANQFCHQIRYLLTDRLQPGEEINYAEYYEFVAKVINKFKRCGIQPCFIFDGVDKPDKLTSERRKKSASGNIPTLAYTVFCNALREMKVNCLVADGEGDKTCAEIARFLDCPVFSCDSDFYLFDLPGGYINIKECLDNRVFDSDSDDFTVQVYYRHLFIRYHFSRDPDFIFLYPAILGNGIHPSIIGNILDPRKYSDVDKVDNCHLNTRRLREDVRPNFEAVRAYYNNLIGIDPDVILSSPIPRCQVPVPEWFRRSYRTRGIPYMLFDALVNCTQHHGSSPLSQRIRQCCYAIIGVRQVTEYQSHDGRVDECPVPCIAGPDPQIVLGQIDEGENETKRNMFYFAMCCRENAVQLDSLNEGDRFIMATIIFWIKGSVPRPSIVLIKALVACYVRLSSTAERGDIVQLFRRYHHIICSAAEITLLKNWQRVYQDALVLFLLLRYLPDSIPCPSRVFNQSIILALAHNTGPEEIDAAAFEFLSDRNLRERYTELIEVIPHD